MRIAFSAIFLASLAAAPAFAGQPVALDSAVFVERIDRSGDGQVERRIEPATRLMPGDKVVLMVEWRGTGSGKGFAVTSPVPRKLAFQRASAESVEVSADGGRSWGRLGELTLRDADGIRLVAPQDVTHLRWRVSAGQAAAGSGRLTYSAVVR